MGSQTRFFFEHGNREEAEAGMDHDEEVLWQVVKLAARKSSHRQKHSAGHNIATFAAGMGRAPGSGTHPPELLAKFI